MRPDYTSSSYFENLSQAAKEAIEMDGPLSTDLVKWWEEFLGVDCDLGDIDSLYASPMFPLQRRREMAAMMRVANIIKPKVVYEIGADKGGGIFAWCKSIPTLERMVVCEIRGTPYKHLMERAFPHIKFMWIEDSSLTDSTYQRVKGWLDGKKLDTLFIDGDKSYFLEDFAIYKPLMNYPSICFMHDIQDPVPGEAFQRVQREYRLRHSRIVDTTESEEAVSMPHIYKSQHGDWLRHWGGKSCGVGVLYL